jgi:hypothetical protein
VKLKNQNALFTLAVSLVTFFNETQLVLAESGTSSTSATSRTTTPGAGLVIAYWICKSQKRKAIGGWLLFYYMQLFGGVIIYLILFVAFSPTLRENLNIGNWNGNTTQYFLYVLSIVPTIILFVIELALGIMLLSKKFRHRKFYNFLRTTIAASLGFGVLALIIDSNYWPENIALDYLPIIIYAFWFLYFTFSRRVKMVIIENKWDANIMYPHEKQERKKPKLVRDTAKPDQCLHCGNEQDHKYKYCQKCSEEME